MRVSEFRKLIREEVKKTLNEIDSDGFSVIELWDKVDGKFVVRAYQVNSPDAALIEYLKNQSKYADYGAQEGLKYIKKSTKLVKDGDTIMYLGKGTFDPDHIIVPGQLDRKAALQILKDKVFNK